MELCIFFWYFLIINFKVQRRTINSAIMRMKFNFFTIFASCFVLFISCSEDQDLEVGEWESFVLGESISTKSDNGQKTYKITTESGMVYDDLLLTEEQVKMVNNSIGIGSPVEVTATGYDSWMSRGTGGDYKLFINGYNDYIPKNIYIARDIYLLKSVSIPTSLAIISTPNEYESTDGYIMGWNPYALNTIGLTAAIGGNNIYMQTAAVLIEYTMLGQEVMMTWPCHSPILDWRLYYIPLV